MFGNRASQASSGRTEDAASWEAPDSAATKPRTGPSGLLKGSLTVSSAIGFLRDNGRRILLLAFVLFTAGIVLLMVIPARYAATALVVVDPREQRVTNEQDVLPGIGQDAAALQSLIEIAKSDGFLRPLIEQLKIQNDADIAGSETDASRLLERFRGRLDISRRGLTYVIAITFISNRPQQAAYYANAVAEAFAATQGQVRTSATDEAAGWLNSRLKTLNDRLRASEDAVANFKLEHKIVNAGKDGTTQQLRVTELNQQVSAARLRAEEAKTRYQQAQRDLKANVEGPIKQDLLSALRAQRSALNDQIAQKRAVLGERHPDLVMAHSQLNDINQQIETERKRNIESAKSEYESLLEQQKSLEARLKSVEAEMLVDGQAQVKLQELQRDADANKNIYEQFLSRFKTTNEQRLLQSTQTKIASLATPPIRSTRPPLPLLLAAMLIASLLVSTAIVAMLDTRQASPEPILKEPVLKAPVVKEPVLTTPSPATAPAAVEPPLDLPVWVRIPYLPPRETRTSVWQKPIGAVEAPDLSPHLRILLDGIASVPTQGGKVVLVTSVESGIGRSSVARSLNLAALNGGMLSVLIQAEPEAALASVAKTSGQAAPTRKASLRSVDVLLSRKAGQAAGDDIRGEFDLIVIDTPSLTAHPEAAALSAHADLVILVTRDGANNIAAIRGGRASLARFGGAEVGMIVNQVSPGAAPAQRRSEMGLAS
jgi:uncharacterized protein involved in exopolysaccharide biosynthesis/Mrp family chromosome partitioning ATPase